jgi:glyoxylase-like metal-dependent hydrolase (beta-lactamase superfamily II)
MQEIASNIFIETGYPGVTLGAVVSVHGLTLLDAPFRIEDVRSWRAALSNLMGSGDRMLVNLDAHHDRTLGARAMECTIIGHENMAQVFRTRSAMFKAQNAETGAEWETYAGLGSIRWAPPDITFSQRMQIYGEGGVSMLLEHCPGPSSGAIWVVLPEAGVVFVGDAVVIDQPPFLATADISAWVELLQRLLGEPYQNMLLVSGRGGLVARSQVQAQLLWLQKVRKMVAEFAERKQPAEVVMGLADELLQDFEAADGRLEQFRNRLRWGVYQYYLRKYRPSSVEVEE